MKSAIEELITHLELKANNLWLNYPKSSEKTYEFGHMTGLEYAIYRLKEILEKDSDK